MQIQRKILEPRWQVNGDYASCSLPTKIALSVSIEIADDGDGFSFTWEVSDAESIEIVSGSATSMPEAQEAAWAAYLDLVFHPSPSPSPSQPPTPVPYTISDAIEAIAAPTGIGASQGYGKKLASAIFGEIYCLSLEHGFNIDYEHYALALSALDAHRTDAVLVKFFKSENLLVLETYAGSTCVRISTRYTEDGSLLVTSVYMLERMYVVLSQVGVLSDLIQALHDFFTHKL